MDKENIVYTYHGLLYSLKKEGNPVICNNMDGPVVHYAKWNKPDAEWQLLYDFTNM